MSFRKCCVGNCSSTNRIDRLFYLPKVDNLRQLWLSFLVPTNIELSGLSKEQLLTKRKRVCQKHFDRYQFDMENRLRTGYPCLFTAKELIYGLPLSSTCDHSYGSQVPELVDNRRQQTAKEQVELSMPICREHKTFVTEHTIHMVLRMQIHNWCNIVNKILKGDIDLKYVSKMGSTQIMAYDKFKSYRLRNKNGSNRGNK